MPKLSLRQASQTFAVSRRALSKALQNGAISGSRNAKGHWQIDSAEMMRTFALRPVAYTQPAQSETGGGHDTHSAATAARLKTELAAEREKMRRLERHLQDMRDDRALLPAPVAKPRRSWWPW